MGQDTITIDVPFGRGTNEKLDASILPNGVLVTCENATFDKGGAIHKRNAFTAVTKAILGGGNLAAVSRLATYKGNLLAIDGHFIYSFDQANNAWVLRDQVPEAYVTTDAVAREANGVASWPVIAENANIRVVAWQTLISLTGTVIVARVTNSQTGAVISEGYMNVPSLVTVRSRPMLVTIGQYIWLVYASGTNIVGNRLDTTAPSTWGAPVTITATYAGNAPLDAAPLDASHWLLAWSDTSAGARVATSLVDTAGNISATAFVGEVPTNSIAVMGTVGENVYTAWHNGANGVRIAGYTTGLGVSFAAVTVNATVVPITDQITLVRQTSTSALVVWREKEAAALRCFTRMRQVSNAGALLAGQQSTYTIGLVSKPFVYDSHTYALVCNSGWTGTASVQPTYFLVDLDTANLGSSNHAVRVVGSAYESVAVARPAQGLCPVANPSTGKFLLVGTIKSRASADYGDLVVQLTLDMANQLRWQSEEFGDIAVFSGGVPMGFDGATCFELGFHLYPELCTATPAGGGALVAGTYAVAVIYEWIDERGQRIQSVPFEIAGIVSGAAGKITVTAPNLNLTAKSDIASSFTKPVSIVVYCTDVLGGAGGGTTFYRQPTTTGVAPSDPTSSTDVSIVITTVNSAAEQLYVTGGVLENAALPPTTTLAMHQNRLWFVSGEDRHAIRYSKEFTLGVSPEFNEGLEFRIDKGGDISAIATMDGRLMVFKSASIFALGGQGATDTGVGDSLGADEVHTEAIGATDPESVVNAPDGLLFRGAKGIHLLDRSLTTSYVGAPIEDSLVGTPLGLHGGTIVAATTSTDSRRIFFVVQYNTGAGGALLVFDTLTSQWSTWLPNLTTGGGATNTNSFCTVVVWSGGLVIGNNLGITTSSPMFTYDATSFIDNAANRYALHFRTGPLRIKGQQDRQRIRHIRFMNTFKDTHALNVSLYRDYVVGSPEVVPSIGTAATANGQVMIAPQRQRCEVMAIDASDDGAGESYSCAGIQLEVSPIRGAFKLPASARV